MPKRTHDPEYDLINDEIKKLKRKLKRVRKRKVQSSDSDTESKNSKEDNNGFSENQLIDLDVNDNITQPEYNLRETDNEISISLNPNTTPECDPTNLDQISSEILNKEYEDTALDKDILEILGDDPTSTIKYGNEIHMELANRLQHTTTTGLTKETRKELQQKYLLPSNAVLLGAPEMNPEIKATLPETLANRDKAIESKQKVLASAISCIASATSYLLETQNKDKELIKKLMDANKLLCDVQHSDSVTRRMFSLSVIKKDVKPQILKSKIDKFLFGENLPDTIKTAKAVSKSSAEIKSTVTRKDNKRPQPSTSKSGHLNVKTQVAPPRRPPGPARKTQQPAYSQSRPGGSFKMSSQPPRTTNYRR